MHVELDVVQCLTVEQIGGGLRLRHGGHEK
jgi:hypothetical protein